MLLVTHDPEAAAAADRVLRAARRAHPEPAPARASGHEPAASAARLRTRRLLGLRALVYFYRRRLRAHGTQELLAGVGIAAAVALVLAAAIAQGSIAGSTRRVLRAVIGPANLQLRARGPDGFPEADARAGRSAPRRRAAPRRCSNATSGSLGPRRAQRRASTSPGPTSSLGVLNGLGRTLPLSASHRARSR